MNLFFIRLHSLTVAFCLLFLLPLSAQKPTPFDLRLKGFDQRKALKDSTFIHGMSPQSIGPSVFSCRVTDIEVNPNNPAESYIAYASGGLWYSANYGTTFTPIFDYEASMSIGDIAVDWVKGVIWVGTGEANSSRSSYSGTGIYRSSDGGKTWEWRGLPESHHIARIVLHPTNPNIIWVAVLGRLYSPNPDRGVYRSADGDLTWQKTLFVNDISGAIDLCVDPSAPNTVYAATWQKERSAWNFSGAGEGSAIWKSTDSGANFVKISATAAGFPDGKNTGRIGLASGLKDGKTILYACVDNQNLKSSSTEVMPKDGLTKDQLRVMNATDFAKLDGAKLEDFLNANNFPKKYTADFVKNQVAKGKISPLSLVEFLEDANSNLFETNYIGAEVFRSDDGGATWKKTHDTPLEQMNFTYGYYFSNIRCLPNNADQVYLLGFHLIKSDDGGKNWTKISGDNVHPDHHALWVHPTKQGLLYNGNDGGLNISWDNGQSWLLCNNPPVGQFYAIAVDQDEPYNVYGGAQDNGVWYGPSDYTKSDRWRQSGQYPYRELIGGDGMQVAVDSRDNLVVYTGFQFGNYFRINRRTGTTKQITPQHSLGERPLRFNWQTPIHLSKHQQDVLYLGANKLYRSFDKGENWECISGDLTGGGKSGNVPFGTLTSIHESPLKFGMIYTGSDDGLVHLSRDGGDTWTRITTALPQGLWVSRVQASAHEKGRVYLALNNYRNDDFTAYLYVSEDFGKQWTRIGSNLPSEPVNVVIEDPVNPDLIFTGTDHGVYFSLDRGKTFKVLSKEFPAVPVHDLVIQSREKDLVIGTHGRSLYKMPIGFLQQLTTDVLAQNLYVFDLRKIRFARGWGKKTPWDIPKDPQLTVSFYAANAGKVTWSVKLKDGPEVNRGTIDAGKGLNQWVYNLELRPDAVKNYAKKLNEGVKDPKKAVDPQPADSGRIYLQRGIHILTLETGGKSVQKEFEVE